MRDRILLVYNADGGVRGELAYFIKKGLGIAKCELCTITHELISERRSWRACKSGIDAEVVGLHRNELSASELAFIAGRYPCVVSERDGELSMIVRPEEFGAYQGRPEKLAEVINQHLAKDGA